MEKIDFRIWHNNKMYYSNNDEYVFYTNNKCGILSDKGILIFTDSISIGMQYTGLKDKNENLIYENDILHNTEYDFKFRIQWGIENESYAGWAGNWLNKDFISPLFNGPLTNCEIIGNIHETPELLIH